MGAQISSGTAVKHGICGHANFGRVEMHISSGGRGVRCGNLHFVGHCGWYWACEFRQPGSPATVRVRAGAGWHCGHAHVGSKDVYISSGGRGGSVLECTFHPVECMEWTERVDEGIAVVALLPSFSSKAFTNFTYLVTG